MLVLKPLMPDDTAAITLENVTKRFGDGAPVLDGVSLSVPARQFLAIVGASGSGKTTLLQHINRLSEPSGGLLRVDAVDVQTLDPIALRRRIGYVFQEVGLFPHLTVAENIAITLRDALGQDYRRLHDTLGLTTVMITHDVLEALGLADRIVVLRAGRLVADGPPSSLLNHENAYVRELMQTPRRIAERVSTLLAAKEQ
jgi:ABC-type proline/glycine betaine transport system ATPase subunit